MGWYKSDDWRRVWELLSKLWLEASESLSLESDDDWPHSDPSCVVWASEATVLLQQLGVHGLEVVDDLAALLDSRTAFNAVQNPSLAAWHRELHATFTRFVGLRERVWALGVTDGDPVGEANMESGSTHSDAQVAQVGRLFPKGFPRSQDLIDAVVLLDTKRKPGISDMQLLREFTGETKESCPKARKLQKDIRGLRSDGRTSLPPAR